MPSSILRIFFVPSDGVAEPAADVPVLEVTQLRAALRGRLGTDDTVWTLHFKLTLTETSGFDFPLRGLE